MSIEDGVARLIMSGHRNSPIFREQIERAQTLRRSLEGIGQPKPEATQDRGRDRSGEFQPIERPSIFRTLVSATK